MARKRAKTTDDWADYVVEIAGWSWSYTLYHADRSRPFEAHEIGEFRHLELDGILREPTVPKCQSVRITLVPSRDFDLDRTVKTVASASLYQSVLTFYANLPLDALPPLLTCLAAERVKFVSLRGAKLRYGKALIQSLHIKENIDDE